MSFLYNALVGEQSVMKPAQQNPQETIDKLCDRLANATLLEDRRAAVLGLKGLSREYQLVGLRPFPFLVVFRFFLHVLWLGSGNEGYADSALLAAPGTIGYRHGQGDSRHADQSMRCCMLCFLCAFLLVL